MRCRAARHAGQHARIGAAERTSLRQLVSQPRFELAKQLLQNTQLSLSEVAAAIRYADPAVFSRAFRSWARMSPKQWRAR
ncbi:MAG: helix-turn-helix domain-containing protein [Betaproteobacteria bacterium]|nr:helix-turn-helix domain-containing protein [Betaproteobacteria bacterium]